MENKRSNSIQTLCVMLIFALFSFFALILIITAINSYKSVSATTDENNQLRSTISYITSKLHASDDGSVIKISTKDDTKLLSIEQTLSGDKYENYLYVKNGALYEQLLSENDDINLEDGNLISKISSFDIEKVSQGLFKITAVTENSEKREAYVNLYTDK